MNQHKFAFSFASIVALLVATPAMGQLTNFPVVSLAPGSAYGTTSVGTAFARRVQNDAIEQSVFVARLERGLETVSFGAEVGYIAGTSDNVTLAGSIAAHLPIDAPVQVSLQTGIGWIRQDILTLNLTTLHMPIGIAFRSTVLGNLKPWVMPRVSFTQSSGNAVAASSTVREFGASAGISYASELGVDLNLAYEYLDATGGRRHRLGAGVSYVLGN